MMCTKDLVFFIASDPCKYDERTNKHVLEKVREGMSHYDALPTVTDSHICQTIHNFAKGIKPSTFQNQYDSMAIKQNFESL